MAEGVGFEPTEHESISLDPTLTDKIFNKVGTRMKKVE